MVLRRIKMLQARAQNRKRRAPGSKRRAMRLRGGSQAAHLFVVMPGGTAMGSMAMDVTEVVGAAVACCFPAAFVLPAAMRIAVVRVAASEDGGGTTAANGPAVLLLAAEAAQLGLGGLMMLPKFSVVCTPTNVLTPYSMPRVGR